MTYSLVYVSRAASSITAQVLLDLMHTSRTANDAAGITGLLLYADGGFMQMIEGRRDRVELLYASIERDARHGQVTLVRAREQDAREFPDWSMGFGAVDDHPMVVSTGTAQPVPTDTEAAFVRDLLDLFDQQR